MTAPSTYNSRRWYIAVPCNLPFSYHRPPMWNNYSYVGPLSIAFKKAIALFEEEGYINYKTVKQQIRDMYIDNEQKQIVYTVECGHLKKLAKQELVIWKPHSETPVGHPSPS